MKSLWDWPFEHKAVTSSISSLYGPLLEGLLDTYFGKQEKIFHINMDREFYFFAGASGYFLNYWWLSLLRVVQRPRIINTPKAFVGGLTEIIGDLSSNPELARTGAKMFSNATNFPNRVIDLRIEAEYFLRSERLGEAMDLYTQYLDIRRKSETEIYERFIDPIGTVHIQTKAKLRGTKENLLKKAIIELWNNDERVFTETWKNILKQYDDPELKVIHAMFLSIAEKEEAIQAWKEIETNPEQKKTKITESRNEVFEIDENYFKKIVIIKKGEKLEKEWKSLKEIRYKLGPKIISITPLTYYQEKNEETGKEQDVLIVKRNQGKDLETLCKENIISQRKETEARKTLENLAILHSTKIEELENYYPLREFERRFLARFSYTKETELLLQSYQWFYERRTQGETLVTSHGDLYPSNVLEGGIIIDFEKICRANPLLDVLTFMEAPQWQNLRKEEILEAYTKKRKIDLIGKEFYTIHVLLCQTGSFSRKSPETAKYFKDKVKRKLWELQEDGLRERLQRYSNVQR